MSSVPSHEGLAHQPGPSRPTMAGADILRERKIVAQTLNLLASYISETEN